MRPTLTVLVTTIALLLGVGVILVATAGGVRAANLFGNPHHFLIRQLIWLAIAVGIGCAASWFDYHWWRDHKSLTIALFALVVLALFLVICPGIRHKINGSYRWLSLGPLSVQPGEFAKIATVIAMSVWLSRIGWRVRLFMKGTLFPILGLGVLLGLLYLEPDYGTMMIVGVIGGALMFVAGTRLVYLIPFGLLGSALLCIKLIFFSKNRSGRIGEWLEGTSHQVNQSLLAFQNGGLWGVGFTQSTQKHAYLPEAHTDFIFSIGGEEFGFLFSVGVVAAFMVILWCGIRISMRAPDSLGRLLAFGMTFLLVFQGAWNIAVVTGVVPTKGLALPFLSYGGTSLVTAMLAIGTLINIGRNAEVCEENTYAQAVKNAPVPL